MSASKGRMDLDGILSRDGALQTEHRQRIEFYLESDLYLLYLDGSSLEELAKLRGVSVTRIRELLLRQHARISWSGWDKHKRALKKMGAMNYAIAGLTFYCNQIENALEESEARRIRGNMLLETVEKP